MHILLLDDHDFVREALERAILSRFPDAEVIACETLSEAEVALEKFDFDFAVLDYDIDNVYSSELADFIPEDLAFVVMTGHIKLGLDDIAKSFAPREPIEVLKKPSCLTELMELLESQLG